MKKDFVNNLGRMQCNTSFFLICGGTFNACSVLQAVRYASFFTNQSEEITAYFL
ncbi:hypothetical protein [Ursidibacter sp. B-7004-1]